jgi:hypothetical protein
MQNIAIMSKQFNSRNLVPAPKNTTRLHCKDRLVNGVQRKIAVHPDNNTKPISTFCGWNAVLLNVKENGNIASSVL